MRATFGPPGGGLPAAAGRGRAATELAIATAAALLFAAVAVPRTDFERAAAAELDDAARPVELTQHDREQAIARARKLGAITAYSRAALLPALFAAGAAVALWVGFRVAGTRPALRPTLAVVVHGMLPVWLGGLLAIPAAIVRAPVPLEDAGRLVPSSLAAWLRPVPPPLGAALSAVDLFTLWAVALVAAGMARASGASRRRAFAVTIVLFLAYVALAKVVPAGAGAGPGPGPR